MPTLGLQTVLEHIGREDSFVKTIPDAKRAPSSRQGLGLFTTRARAAGELVCVLDGQRISLDDFPEVLDCEWNALTERVLLVRPVRTSYGYINHSFTPNLVIEADGQRLVTARAIGAGEELTLDYFQPIAPHEFLISEEAKRLRGAG